MERNPDVAIALLNEMIETVNKFKAERETIDAIIIDDKK